MYYVWTTAHGDHASLLLTINTINTIFKYIYIGTQRIPTEIFHYKHILLTQRRSGLLGRLRPLN